MSEEETGSTAKLRQIVSAEPGWRALFGVEREEVGRSRIVAWALVEEEGREEIVGLIVDLDDPTRIRPAPDMVDAEGHRLLRYGFVEPSPPSSRQADDH
ncbi:MAG: hypothetical protein M3P15_10905 [Actinomycetota bacterium]|nr:hypothetical protein [Actinomycetota bacterium]